MNAPLVATSTQEEREEYVIEQWKCLGHCASCGKCSILRNRDERKLYADYIDGVREYLEITKELKEK